MRSILKTHRRSNSSASDQPTSQSESQFVRPHASQIDELPKQQKHVRLSSPSSAVGNYPSTVNSPKKLLTPIMKIFGHHSRAAAVPQSAEALQFITSDDTGSHGNTVAAHSNEAYWNLSNMEVSHRTNPSIPAATASTPGQLSQGRIQSEPNLIERDTNDNHDTNDLSKLHASGDSQWRIQTDANMQINSANTSDVSISSSKKSLVLSSAMKEIDSSRKYTERESKHADDDSTDSDTSSQFSFVKDERGGRNTSVKYYKTRVEAEHSTTPHYFNIDDTGFEVDALSDYDYENNGLSDDGDFHNDFPEGSNRYEDFLAESLSDVAGNFRSYLNSCGPYNVTPQLENPDVFSSKITLGISSPRNYSPDLRSPAYGGDFLDAYLDSSSPTNASHVPENLIISSHAASDIPTNDEGLGLGIAISPEQSSEAPRNDSGEDIMGRLMKLEGGMSDNLTRIGTGPEPKNAHLRHSASQGENDTDLVDADASATSVSSSNRDQRRSVAEMMATLSLLGNVPELGPPDTSISSTVHCKSDSTIDHKKRYSWLSNEDSLERNDTFALTGTEENKALNTFDEDLIDEVNEIPENYDFANRDQLDTSQKQQSGFLRTNSHNKRPQKAATDRCLRGNKIDLRDKTVTFFRSKSLGSMGSRRVWAPARAASSRSMTLLVEDDISEGEEQDFFDSVDSPMRSDLHFKLN